MKIAIVTGASSGMGREFVLQLSQYVSVDEVWVIARRTRALEDLRAQVSVALRPITLDLCADESFTALSDILKEEQPDVKLLVNAAGFGKFGSSVNIPVEEECRMIDLNCKALVRMTRAVLPYMHRGSHILQLDSLSAFQPVPYITTYGATKASVLSYSRAMNPGWVKTEFFNHALQTNGSEVQYYNYLWEARDVVATGLKDLYKTKKDYSVHGLPIKFQVLLVKIMPHWFVMNVWLNQQKKPKNNKDLTK